MRARSAWSSAARELVNGRGPCLPPSEQWDRDFLDRSSAAGSPISTP